jgi:hypothetical protein
MAVSPYSNAPMPQWQTITSNLINQYPIAKEELLEIAILSWDRLWASEVGGQIRIDEVDLPATVVGYFFQKLFSHELSIRYPDDWKGEELKSDKDLVHKRLPQFSTEMKASGQLRYSLFGNRSYNQQSENMEASGKDKSGYYITLNFYGKTLTLLRLGWIDQDDWIPQGAETGQAAVLKPEVYTHKLVEINGPYRNASPVRLLNGIGPKKLEEFHENGVYTFGDIKAYRGTNTKILKIKTANSSLLNSF